MKKVAIAALALLVASTGAFAQTHVSPKEPESRPESMAVGPDGTLYIGSQKDARIYRARPGQAVAEQFIDMRPSALVLGVLTDGASNTLWACEMVNLDRSTPLLKGKGILRGFDLKSGAPKVTIPLPEQTNICNDFAVGPDKALYVADTSNGKVLRLRPGATSTKAGAPVQIHTPRVLKGPDGMRVQNGVMYLAEAGNGTVSRVAIKGDVATLTTIKDGMDGPCALEPHGKTLWVVERPSNRVTAVPIP